MGINAFGTDNFLRSTIRSRLTTIRRDDQLIDREGIEELSTSELQAACQSRGIRTSGVSPARLREELATWIRLHLHNRVSGVLLVLARAFQFDRTPGEDEDGTFQRRSFCSEYQANEVSCPPVKLATVTARAESGMHFK